MTNRSFLFGSITFSRTIYAFSWYVMAESFPSMAVTFGYHLQTLGYFTSAFLVGAGIFQIPAGIFSARRGATNAAMLGLAVLTITSFASIGSGDYQLQLALRFISGAGAAFYFAPGLVISSSALSRRSGFASGVYAAMFNVGGIIASFSFTLLSKDFGWQVPFIVTGAATLVALLENAYAFRGYRVEGVLGPGSVRKTLTSRNVWAVMVAVLGLSAVNYVVTQFLVTYLEQNLLLAAATAGTVSALLFVGGLFGGPTLGWLSDNFGRRRLFIILPTVMTALAVLALTFSSLVILVVGVAVMGFFMSGSYANAYAYPTQLKMETRYAALAVAMINTTGILYGSVVAPTFAITAEVHGFFYAWLALVLVSILPIVFILMAAEPGRDKPRDLAPAA